MQSDFVTRRPWVPKMASTSGSAGNSTKTLSPSTLTGKVMMLRGSSAPNSRPSSRLNCFLCKGQATLGVPAESPTKPCERTKACLCGHMFCVQYHSPRAALLKTANWVSLYKIAVPTFGAKSETLPTSTQDFWDLAKISPSGVFHMVWGCPSLGQSAGRFCPRMSMNSTISSFSMVLAVFANCLNLARRTGSLTTSAHSSW
mmetsp:Transcript_7111/g.14039  ORF Transcript_7111/g.14039 Transcript_7111/m.14039 type:complete len:201 (-) Transcript_7111:2756-3358(-)